MERVIFGLLTLSMLVFSSCSPQLSPFTQDLPDRYGWSEEDLREIQFFLSDDIVLRREYEDGVTTFIDGSIKVEEGRSREEVLIRAGTPGVFLFSPKRNRLAIGFEDDDRYFLIFGPSPRVGDRYVLLASRWERNAGTVTYGGRKYRVDAAAAYATLMVDLKKASRYRSQSRVAPGRRVGN